MNRMILRQMWNQRRANGWIWAELILVTYFLWGAIDPVYVLMANRAIPDGFQLDDVYLLKVGEYTEKHRLFDKTPATDSMKLVDYMRIVDRVKQYPGVTHLAVTVYMSYPQSGSWYSGAMHHDTLTANVKNFEYLSGGDYFGVFRMLSADGKQMPVTPPGESAYYITANLAATLFPQQSARGGKIYGSDSTQITTVTDVVATIQDRSINQPVFIAIQATPRLNPGRLSDGVQVCFRVRDGLGSASFAEEFKQTMRPQMRVGNFYLSSLTDFPQVSRQFEYSFGITSKLRMQAMLAGFFLFCTFLGIAGTFWLRGNARREEVGLRIAMGSSRRMVIRQFLTEAWILTTIGFIVGLLVVLQRLWYEGFFEAPHYPDLVYIQNRPIPHFLIVSALVYGLLMLITTIGAWVPALRASSVNPVDALRDE